MYLYLPKSRNTAIRILERAIKRRITQVAIVIGFNTSIALNNTDTPIVMSQAARAVTNILVTVRRDLNRTNAKITMPFRDTIRNVTAQYKEISIHEIYVFPLVCVQEITEVFLVASLTFHWISSPVLDMLGYFWRAWRAAPNLYFSAIHLSLDTEKTI